MSLIISRDKHLIYITNSENGSELRYNLKEKSMQKHYKRVYKFRANLDKWQNVATQYEFFRNFRINDMIVADKNDAKFIKLLEESKRLNKYCSSLSTFFSRMNEALAYESFIDAGILYEKDYCSYGQRTIKKHEHSLNEYNKLVIKFLKDTQMSLTFRFERNYFQNITFCNTIFNKMQTFDLDDQQKIKFIKYIMDSAYTIDIFKEIVETHKYDMKALVEYFYNYLEPFENLSINNGLDTLKDYYTMGVAIGRQIKKYPKYLKSMHDIINANHNAYKKEYDEMLFEQKQKAFLEFVGKKYSVVIPRKAKDVIIEGTNLNHCVSSYVDKILQDKTYILFLRLTESPDRSLVTLEFKDNTIVQARGSCNRDMFADEKKFLEEYCEKLKLGCEV